jgi:hypothetical protein
MGISIESYRSRIGTFSNNRDVKPKLSYQNVTKQEQMMPKQHLKLLVMLAIIFVGSFQFPKDNLNNHPSGRLSSLQAELLIQTSLTIFVEDLSILLEEFVIQTLI